MERGVMSGNTIHFTKESLGILPPANKNFDTYKDAKEKGLVVLVTLNGVKTFYLSRKIEGKAYRIKIGRFPDLNVKEAREYAIELKNQIAKGVNPAEEKKKLSNEITFKQLIDKYVDEYARHSNKGWQRDYVDVTAKCKSLLNKKISTISKASISKLFSDITEESGTSSANRNLALIKAIFNKAINEWEWVGVNPAIGIKKHKLKARDRYLTKEEIPLFFEAVGEDINDKVTDYIMISLLTGARQSDVLSMSWQNISFQSESWYIYDPKNSEPQHVPLVQQAVTILKQRFDNRKSSKWVFESETSASGHLEEPKKAWYRIKKSATYKVWLNDSIIKDFILTIELKNPNASFEKLFEVIISEAKKQKIELPVGVMDLRLHDLRRSLGSWMAINGASQYIIGKTLNHKSSKATDIYAKLSIDPVRESMKSAVNLMLE